MQTSCAERGTAHSCGLLVAAAAIAGARRGRASDDRPRISSNPWLDALARLAVVAIVLPVGVILLTWVERKVIGRLQMRLGPMRVGPYGLLQGVADTIKLLTKEDVRPHTADRWMFELALSSSSCR